MSTTEEPLAMAETLTEIKTSLAIMTTKLDQLVQRWDPIHTDHESRLRKLEAKVWIASGAALAGGSGLGAVIAHFTGA